MHVFSFYFPSTRLSRFETMHVSMHLVCAYGVYTLMNMDL